MKLINTITDGLKSFYDDTINNGIVWLYYQAHWDSLNQQLDSPLSAWLTEDVAKDIDRDYYLSHSGDKCIAAMYHRYIEMSKELGETDTKNLKVRLMDEIVGKFADKWNRLYAVITANYSPLENYNMEQAESPNITKEKKIKSEIVTDRENDITDNDIYGFNSSDSVPQTKSTRNGKITVSADDTKNIETEKESGFRTITRHGNIGVTTSQQMLLSEVDLRDKVLFLNIIMEDMDSELCLLTY